MRTLQSSRAETCLREHPTTTSLHLGKGKATPHNLAILRFDTALAVTGRSRVALAGLSSLGFEPDNRHLCAARVSRFDFDFSRSPESPLTLCDLSKLAKSGLNRAPLHASQLYYGVTDDYVESWPIVCAGTTSLIITDCKESRTVHFGPSRTIFIDLRRMILTVMSFMALCVLPSTKAAINDSENS
jgi:hypothetical protein